jgi:hypothetical protein
MIITTIVMTITHFVAVLVYTWHFVNGLIRRVSKSESSRHCSKPSTFCRSSLRLAPAWLLRNIAARAPVCCTPLTYAMATLGGLFTERK